MHHPCIVSAHPFDSLEFLWLSCSAEKVAGQLTTSSRLHCKAAFLLPHFLLCKFPFRPFGLQQISFKRNSDQDRGQRCASTTVGIMRGLSAVFKRESSPVCRSATVRASPSVSQLWPLASAGGQAGKRGPTKILFRRQPFEQSGRR